MIWWIQLVILIGIGGYDIYLAVKDKPTLTHLWQALWPQKVDVIIFMAISGAILYYLATCKAEYALQGMVLYIYGAVNAHLNWISKERHN